MAVAVKRVRVDDGAVAAQVRMEMRVLSRAMRRDRARVGGRSSSAALTATVKDGGGDARIGFGRRRAVDAVDVDRAFE